MKRMGLLLGLVAVIALVTVGSALAAEGKTKGAGGRPPIGEITKIDGKTLTVSVKAEGAAATDVTGTVDESTEITKAEAAKAEALKVGDNVRITQGDKRASGEITKIEGKTLTVKGRRGEESITLDDTATILLVVKAKFEDLKVGQKVMMMAKDGKVARISIQAPGAKEEGKAK